MTSQNTIDRLGLMEQRGNPLQLLQERVSARARIKNYFITQVLLNDVVLYNEKRFQGDKQCVHKYFHLASSLFFY